MNMLEDYQLRFVSAVEKVIAGNWLQKSPKIRVLDMGCDCSGRQLAEISRLIRGEAVGINIPPDFPTPLAKITAGNRVQLIRMDGMNLDFPDASFDLVISANVIEHVPDPTKFIREAARVLKPNGICYLETAPVWTGPRGHHIMESMIAENCPNEKGFRDDGTVIHDWSHLFFDRQQMEAMLLKSVLPDTKDYILNYLYDSKDLNKVPWREIKQTIVNSFPLASITPILHESSNNSLMPNDGLDDYRVYGFHALCRKKPKPWLQKKLCYRLRRLGL
jgi:ubiquinone/menaquinone biosynthesis C-methylase UbiE